MTTKLPPIKQLSIIDRFLSLWILLTMVSGTLLGIYVSSVQRILDGVQVVGVSIPIFLGLLIMLYPVFCKVNYEQLPILLKGEKNSRFIAFSLFMNWIVCPLLMAALAWATLPDLPHYRTGVLLIGVARCIAMVLIWVDLAEGDNEWCVILVTINSLLQIILYSPLAYFYTVIIGQGTGSVDMWPVAKNVLIFLGVPFLAGFLTRFLIRNVCKKKTWYDEKFIPFISPLALLGLLFTIFIMFALQGHQIVEQIGPVFRVVVPLVLYFIISWFLTLYLCRLFKFHFKMGITQSFTAGSNNFELAMAIAIGTYGVESQEALATTIGPLVEVPLMMALVNISFLMRNWYYKRVPE